MMIRRPESNVCVLAFLVAMGTSLACENSGGDLAGGNVDAAPSGTLDTGPAPVAIDTATPAPDARPVSDTAAPPVSPSPGTGIAVVVSDYRSMSLSLINPRTLIVEKERCVDSGSKSPQLSQAFSGDVSLPNQPPPGGKILLIDRSNGTLTTVDPVTCAIERQLSVATGFFANPHDAVRVGGKLFVSRYEPNPKPTALASDFDEGNDLLIVDLESGKPEGRIDLTAQATKAKGTVLARPDRMVVVGGKIYLTLNEIGPNFAEDEIGPGRVVVIDPATRSVVEVIDLTGLENCGGITEVPGAGGVAVTCNGNFNKFDGTQINTSGIAWLPVAPGAPARKTIAAQGFGRPVSFADLLVLDLNNAFVVVPGNFGGKPSDTVFAFDFASGVAMRAFEGASGFVLGNIVSLGDGARILVAHADPSRPRVQLLNVSDKAAVKATTELNASLITGLPPRAIAWY